MASAGQEVPAAAQAMPAADAPAAAPEETQQAHADGAHAAPATENDVGARDEDSGDVPDTPGGSDAGGTGANVAMPSYAYDQGAPPAFGLPDAYLPPWLQGAEGMPMPFPPFSPPYYYQGPYMDVAEAYNAASAAANGGLVGAGAFAPPSSPLLTPSMLGALSLSPLSMMSPNSAASGMQMPLLYVMPDGSASFDPAAAAAALAHQYQQHAGMLMSPQGYMPAGPYAMAPQMYDSYEAGDALPSPRHQQEHGSGGGGRARGAVARTGRSGMVVPQPLPPSQQQQPPREAAGAPAGGSPPSSRAAEPTAKPAGRTGSGAGGAPVAGDAPSSVAAAAEGAAGAAGTSQRSSRRVGVSATDVLSETSRGPRAARGVSPSHADGTAPAAPVAAAPSEDAAVAAAAAALTASATAEDGATASERSADGGAAAPPEAPVDVAALLSCRSLAVLPPVARYFVVKSYSEDDVHKAIKYGCWSSTPAGNKRLDAAYRDACAAKPPVPVLLLFSVNASGQFCGVAQLVSRVDASATAPFWQQSAKWTGSAQLRWHAVKDVPNAALRHVAVGIPPGIAAAQSANASAAAIEALATAAAKPLTNSRDTQELSYAAGTEALRIIRDYPSKTSLLGDFQWYGEREAERERLRAIGAIAGGVAAASPPGPGGAAIAPPLPLPTTPPGAASAAPSEGSATKGSEK